MRVLLDTQSFIWFISSSVRLSSAARTVIADTSNELIVSVASLWEMAIKVSIGKLVLHQPYETLIPQQLAYHGIALLSVELPHMIAVSKLPFHHRDPFDRMLIAQSLVENVPIVSSDAVFDAYGVKRLW
jgi:PIN domain nuclease of toxin-antitoxin system